ncbi:hypothetical protein PIB30_020817 [Stylosanthes scabra]|uniref:Uncharacterized protein n=1 Tax=Stylosanthes scabra TaxID=79078 RepID=A0ABU6T904_9FABA|nr:hypothetical protein [Stylosanthes scabra]
MAENPEDGPETAAAGAVQMPLEVSPLYRWVAPYVLGAPPILSQAYVDELKELGVIFGGGELERRYRVEAARQGERRLLNRACIAPSQLHPNAWASIRCFELVTEWLQLPPSKHQKIFGLFEDSFHDFKGRFFKILPLGDHRPFWLSLEGDGRFPSYWIDRAGFDVAQVTYKGLRVHQRETVDVLTTLFAQNILAPKVLLGRPEDARRDVVSMAENNVTLNRLRGLVRPPSSTGAAVPTTPVIGHAGSGPSSAARGSALPVGPTSHEIITPEEGSSNDGGRVAGGDGRAASPVRDQQVSSPSPSKRSGPAETSAAKRQRTETSVREFSPLDRSFDASKFISENLLGPKT